jgi:hypothetical protein
MLIAKFERTLRVLSGLAALLTLFQVLGVVMYLVAMWPSVRGTLPLGVSVVGAVGVTAVLARSCLWVAIYALGARVVSALHGSENRQRLVARLGRLKRFLVSSCVLDLCLLPAFFSLDAFFPERLSSTTLGLTEVGVLVFPQAFGLAALVLAYILHHTERLILENATMEQELSLTI